MDQSSVGGRWPLPPGDYRGGLPPGRRAVCGRSRSRSGSSHDRNGRSRSCRAARSTTSSRSTGRSGSRSRTSRSARTRSPIVQRGGIELQFFVLKALEPADSYSTCYVLVSDVDTLYQAFTDGLRAALGRVPSRGIPRINPLKDMSYGVRQFIVVDPGGNYIRIGQPIATRPALTTRDGRTTGTGARSGDDARRLRSSTRRPRRRSSTPRWHPTRRRRPRSGLEPSSCARTSPTGWTNPNRRGRGWPRRGASPSARRNVPRSPTTSVGQTRLDGPARRRLTDRPRSRGRSPHSSRR